MTWGRAELAAGSVSANERRRAERLAQQQVAHERQQAERARLQRFVDRFKAKATKARQAQSRVKALERMTEIAAVRAESGIEFGFADPLALPDPLLTLEGLAAASQWIGHVAEPWFMMGVIAFALGDRQAAGEWLAQRSAAQGQGDPALGLLDLCEIAWLLLYAYLAADEELFRQMTDCAAATSHVAIRRMQWLIDGAKPIADLSAAALDGPRPDDRLSIHWLGDEDFDSWFALIRKILVANDGPTAQAA